MAMRVVKKYAKAVDLEAMIKGSVILSGSDGNVVAGDASFTIGSSQFTSAHVGMVLRLTNCLAEARIVERISGTEVILDRVLHATWSSGANAAEWEVCKNGFIANEILDLSPDNTGGFASYGVAGWQFQHPT